jgi:4-hydroxy-3-methylbut-2-enyl diphosphate reductase
MIKKVVREIEGIRSGRETIVGQCMRKGLKFLLLSNGLAAFGAFSLSSAMPLLINTRSDFRFSMLAFLYVYAMHVINRFLDKGASTYNDPERANFYKQHRLFLVLSCLLAFIGVLTCAFLLGLYSLLAMAGLSFFGIIYSIRIIPMGIRFFRGYEKIKDIPGSKNLSEALAWGAVVIVIPLLSQQHLQWLPSLLSFLLVFCLVYTRSAIFDFFQVQGDMIVGAESLPISLGEQKTLVLLKIMLVTAAGTLIIAASVGLISSFAYLLLFCFISLFLCLIIYEKKWLYPGNRFEFLVEGSLVLSGLLGLIWRL